MKESGRMTDTQKTTGQQSGETISPLRKIRNISQEPLTTKKTVYEELKTKKIDSRTKVSITRAIIEQMPADPMTEIVIDAFIAKLDPTKPKDQETEAALEKERARNQDLMWLRTTKDLPIGKTLKYLRLAEFASQEEREKEIGMGERRLVGIESDVRVPELATLNELIYYSVLDERGKTAQSLRLKRAKRKPFSRDEFKTATYAETLDYIQTVVGVSNNEVAKGLNRSSATVQSWRTRRRRPSIDEITQWMEVLQVSQQDAELIRKSYPSRNENIVFAKDLPKKAFSNYLVAEDLEKLTDYPVSPEDQAMIASIMELGDSQTLGRTLLHLRKQFSYSQEGLASNCTMKQLRGTFVSKIETNHLTPNDATISAIAKTLGYDIHHPITHYLLALGNIGRATTSKKKTPEDIQQQREVAFQCLAHYNIFD